MAPFIRESHSTAANNKDVNELGSNVSIKKWSCAADDDWSDYDALINGMNLEREQIVNILLEKGSRVVKQGNATSSLHTVVAKMGWLTVIEKLISLGARATDKNSHLDTTLHLAFVNGVMDRMLDKLLIKYLSETKINMENNDGLSFLHIACTKSSVLVQQFIVRGGANIDCQVNLYSQSKYAGYTPLHFAVLFSRCEVVSLLLHSGANLYVQDCNGATPIHLALYTGNQEMIDLLFSHDKRRFNCIDNFGVTHFMAACAGSVTPVVEDFLYERPEESILVNSRVGDKKGHLCAGYLPIHFAAEFGNIANVQVLLDYGASCFSVTTDNWTPVALAKYSGREDIVYLLEKYSVRENELSLVNEFNGMTFESKL